MEQEMKSTQKKSEPADDGFNFEVGAMYENMKGAYQVISIQQDSMVIRWNDGSEILTPVELQKRIIDRMAHEEELRLQKEVQDRETAQKKRKKK
jgi:hypothetical protein